MDYISSTFSPFVCALLIQAHEHLTPIDGTVRFIPNWMPGASFKCVPNISAIVYILTVCRRIAQHSMQLSDRIRFGTFVKVKELHVRILISLYYSHYTCG